MFSKNLACQAGWRAYGPTGLCYKFQSDKKSWEAARAHCQSIAPTNKTGDLASVGDSATNMFLSSMTTEEQVWLGGFMNEDGDWVWSDGRKWVFTSWYTGQPNNGGGIQKFVTINFGEEGGWNDNNGNSERHFLCQYNIGKHK